MNFGPRLAALRKATGYTQWSSPKRLEAPSAWSPTTRRPVVCPPADLLPDMARALGISVDELRGVGSIERAERSTSSGLRRRVRGIEKLDARARRQNTRFLDTFIEREELEQKVQAKQPA